MSWGPIGKVAELQGRSEWLDIDVWGKDSAAFYLRCDNCKSIAQKALIDPPNLGPATEPDAFPDPMQAALSMVQNALPKPETRTERLVRAVLASPGRELRGDEARALVAFVRRIEAELDAPREIETLLEAPEATGTAFRAARYRLLALDRGAWWVQSQRGYTREFAQAGLFTLARALEFCQRSNITVLEVAIIPDESIWSRQGLTPQLLGMYQQNEDGSSNESFWLSRSWRDREMFVGWMLRGLDYAKERMKQEPGVACDFNLNRAAHFFAQWVNE